MTDCSSRPQRSPSRCPRRMARRIVNLRSCRRWGPHRIAYHLGIPRSTVGRVLTRYRMALLAHLDQATRLPVRGPLPVRYEASRPDELVHVDIKKLGRIPDGGGWRGLLTRLSATPVLGCRHRPGGPRRRRTVARLRPPPPRSRRLLAPRALSRAFVASPAGTIDSDRVLAGPSTSVRQDPARVSLGR
jgi:hypothetical protein